MLPVHNCKKWLINWTWWNMKLFWRSSFFYILLTLVCSFGVCVYSRMVARVEVLVLSFHTMWVLEFKHIFRLSSKCFYPLGHLSKKTKTKPGFRIISFFKDIKGLLWKKTNIKTNKVCIVTTIFFYFSILASIKFHMPSSPHPTPETVSMSPWLPEIHCIDQASLGIRDQPAWAA